MFARQPNVRRYGLAGILMLLLISLPGDLWSQQEKPGRQSDLTMQEIATIKDQIRELNGRAIIGFKPVDAAQGMRSDGTPALAPDAVTQLAADLAPLGVRVTNQFWIIPAVAVVLDPDRLEELLANPNIDYVEPDYLHEPTAQTTPWGINRVNAPAAWAFTKGSGASVGIMDTGIDEDHPDLNPIGGKNFVTGGTARSDWDDNSSFCPTHGTHVAGSAAALDNTTGVVGVAPLADLYSLRVFDPEGEGITYCSAFLSAIIPAIQWAAANGIDVINMSFSSWYPAFSEADALFAAYSAGVLPVAAAGNDYLDGQVLFPAAFPHVIAVAAIDGADNVASFSNTGPNIELAAPGVSVLSTVGGGGYASWNGTSMASPHVAGAATLVRAARPGLSVDEVRQVLRSTADDISPLGFDWSSGYGVVDAGAAVAAVASTNLALSLHPGELTLAVEPGGTPIVTPVEVRNIGAAGTINWSATDDATWITLSPTSGSASDVTPGRFDVTANPSGLSTGFHTGFVTVSGNAANSPVTMRVRLAVAPRITLDPAVTTAGMLAVGERVRYLVAGTAGQEIDVAVLTDYTASPRLYDPVVRVYMPDGETLLDWSDMAPLAGLGYQALVYRVELPETGDYVVEVGSWADAMGGGYLLKARPAGPILGFSPYYVSQRGEQNGADASTSFLVYNLSGLGTLDWTGTPSQDWITISPSAGTASEGELITLDDYSLPETPTEEAQSEVSGADPAVAGALDRNLVRGLLGAEYDVPDERLAEPHMVWLQAAAREAVDPPRLSREVQATTVTVDLDPTGLPLKWNYGDIDFQPADGWLSDQQVLVSFFVYSQGIDIVSSGHLNVYETATDDTRPGDPPVMVGTGDAGGSLFAVPRVGPLGTPLATDVYFPGGLATNHDANWLVYDRLATGHYIIWQFLRDGTRSVFVEDPTLPAPVFWLTWGPDGNLFGSTGCWAGGQVYDIAGDGSTVDPVSPSLPSCVGGVAYRPQDNSLYIANLLDYGLTKLSLDDGSTSTLATDVYRPMAVAVGNSGVVYFTDDYGSVWSVDPDVTSTATRIGVTPGMYDLYGIDLVNGKLVISNRYYGEFYRFPIDDEPIPHPGPEGGLYVAHFASEDMSTMAYPDVGDPSAMHGEPFELPQILYSTDGSDLPAAAFVEEISWSPADITYVGREEGDFGGTFLCNEGQVDQGTLACTAARVDAVGVPEVTLLTLQLDLDPALERGACVPVAKLVTELSGPLGEDLLPDLDVWSPMGIGVSEWPYGDVTRDEPPAVGAADAVQILRYLIGLPICPNCDIALGDVDRDGSVAAADAVFILRDLVGLPLPPYARIGEYGLAECQVP
ncbi:MAG: S8 family serine peptidase [Gemmatimonadales bacterium]